MDNPIRRYKYGRLTLLHSRRQPSGKVVERALDHASLRIGVCEMGSNARRAQLHTQDEGHSKLAEVTMMSEDRLAR